MTRATSAAPATHLLAALLLALLAGCAGAPPAPSPKPQAEKAAPSAAAAAASPEVRAERARRLFDDAAKSQGEQEAAKAPDWAGLEGRWRAVLAAAEVPEARYNLGVALERQGRLDEARAEYQAVLARRPLRQAAVNLGVVAERSGDARGAAQAYSDAVRDFPEEGLARARLGALYRQAGQLDEAWRLSREALLRDPGNAVAVKTMIRVALARNDLDLARLLALRGQKVAPDDAEVAFLSGQIALKQGDEPGALAQWKRALALSPGLVTARAGLLEVAVRHERWSEVSEQAAGILRDDPANAPVQLVLGIAERHLGKLEEALGAYRAAEQLSGGRLAEVHLARGILLMRDKADCQGALAAFDQYEKAAGPVLPQGSPAPRLMRECQEQLEQGRQAAEAAKAMQAEAEKKAAAAAARQAATPAPAAPAAPSPRGEGAAPTPPPKAPAAPTQKR